MVTTFYMTAAASMISLSSSDVINGDFQPFTFATIHSALITRVIKPMGRMTFCSQVTKSGWVTEASTDAREGKDHHLYTFLPFH